MAFQEKQQESLCLEIENNKRIYGRFRFPQRAHRGGKVKSGYRSMLSAGTDRESPPVCRNRTKEGAYSHLSSGRACEHISTCYAFWNGRDKVVTDYRGGNGWKSTKHCTLLARC